MASLRVIREWLLTGQDGIKTAVDMVPESSLQSTAADQLEYLLWDSLKQLREAIRLLDREADR